MKHLCTDDVFLYEKLLLKILNFFVFLSIYLMIWRIYLLKLVRYCLNIERCLKGLESPKYIV